MPGLPGGAPGRESYNPICDTACTIVDNAGQEREVRREAFNTLLLKGFKELHLCPALIQIQPVTRLAYPGFAHRAHVPIAGLRRVAVGCRTDARFV